jgi:hypothetical protein
MTYTQRNGSSLKACWLGGKRNHFDTGGLNIKTAGMVHMNAIWLVVPPCLSHAIIADLQP